MSLILCLFLISHESNAEPIANVTYIRAGLLYDGTGAPPEEDVTVIIGDSTILNIIPTQAAPPLPNGATELDFSEQTVMPGLFDTHGHLRYRYAGGGAAARAAQAVSQQGALSMRMVKNARTQLLSGITTMRITGEVAFLDFAIKDAIDSGMIPGPNIIPSGRLLTSTGGHAGHEKESQVNGADEMIMRVRENFHHGARLIKLSMMDLSPKGGQLMKEEVAAAVETAHTSGIPVTIHCTGNWGSCIRTAIDAGVDTIEHARPLNKDIIQLLKKNKTNLSLTPLVYIGFRPNAEWWQYLDHSVNEPEDWILFMRQEIIDWRERHPQWELQTRPYADGESNRATRDFFPAVKKRQAQVLKAYQAGIPIGLGLDTIYGALTLTMEWMVEAGIPLTEVIHMATGSAAKISQVDHKTGTIEVGKAADIISVAGDPRVDILNLHKINLVMKNGKRVDTLSWN